MKKNKATPDSLLTREYVETFVNRVHLCCAGDNTPADKVYVDRTVE